MVSLWPFGGKESSPDAFERKLSLLAVQIQEHEKKLNNLRGRGRRLKALWTLYTILSWAVYAIVLVVVVGLDKASSFALGGLVGSPFLIYLVRKLIVMYYDWRIKGFETSLQSLQAQQRENIEKLKAATKFNSTQALLERYGGSAGLEVPKPGPRPKSPGRQNSSPKRPGNMQRSQTPPRKGQQQQQQQQPGQQITPIQLPRAQAAGPMQPLGESPLRQSALPGTGPSSPQMPHVPPHLSSIPGAPIHPSAQLPPMPEDEPRSPKWYDRFIDVLLGEDEMSPKARYALICSNCRQVNGLAPPGTANVNDIRYRCGRCGAENGKPEVSQLIGQIAEDNASQDPEESEEDDGGSATRKKGSKGPSSKKSKKRQPVKVEEESDEEEPEEQLIETDEPSEEEVVKVVRKRKSARSGKKA